RARRKKPSSLTSAMWICIRTRKMARKSARKSKSSTRKWKKRSETSELSVVVVGAGWRRFRPPGGYLSGKSPYQVAAPAEMRTPNVHRAKIAQPRVRMEGWRQRRPGSNGKTSNEEGKR